MKWKIGLGVALGAAILGGCAKTGEDDKNTLTVLAFKGGYDVDFYQKAGEEFQAKNPPWKVKVEGSPDIADQVRTDMLAGNPPDLMYPSWKYDLWNAAGENQLLDLNKALDSPPYDGTGTWRDTFEPSILKLGQQD